MQNSPFLHFVVIGAMKAGTSSLYNYLSMHPELSLPHTEKEVNFFNNDDHWKAGIDWYKRNFEANDLNKGEVNPNYAMFPRCKVVPERLYSFSPDAKLIYILRDPIERLRSHIHHNYIKGLETRSLKEILEDKKDCMYYLSYSKYYSQLENFLPYYDKQQILIVTLENLSKEPTLVMQRIFDFLEVDPDYFSEEFRSRKHVSDDKVKPGELLKLFRNTSLMKFYQLFKPLLPLSFHAQGKRMLGQSIEKPNLTNAQISYLIEIFKVDIDKLRCLTEHNFHEWNHQY